MTAITLPHPQRTPAKRSMHMNHPRHRQRINLTKTHWPCRGSVCLPFRAFLAPVAAQKRAYNGFAARKGNQSLYGTKMRVSLAFAALCLMRHVVSTDRHYIIVFSCVCVGINRKDSRFCERKRTSSTTGKAGARVASRPCS